MKTIRYGSFETNSSSTHSIVVPKEVKEDGYDAYDSLDHDYGFGREECRLCDSWDEKLAYAYMLLIDNDVAELDTFKNQVIEIWGELFGNKDYTPTPKDVFDYIDRDGSDGDLTGKDGFLVLKARYGNYIDHSCGLENKDILNRLINDKEFVKRFIFNRNSYITIGGDEYRGYNIKTIGFEYDYDRGNHCVNENGEEPPEDWFDEKDMIKDEYFDRYCEEYPYENRVFWKKLKEYEKDNDVYLKGN